MIGFEPRISGVGSNRSTNCATTTAQKSWFLTQSNDDIFEIYSKQLMIAFKTFKTILVFVISVKMEI